MPLSSLAGIKRGRRTRACTGAASARSASPILSPSPSPSSVASTPAARSKKKMMPREVARDIMLLLAQRWDRIQAYKRHGKDGAPVTGKIYMVAAEYLLSCPESSYWIVDDEPLRLMRLSNYIKNALDAGKKYARQELYTSGATPVTPTKSYDWWDIEAVQQLFKTTEKAKQEHRRTDFSMPEDDNRSLASVVEVEVPVIAMSETATNCTAEDEQAVGAEVLGQRRTSLGRSVSDLKSVTIPLLQQLSSHLDSKSTAAETEHMRITKVFKWLYSVDSSNIGRKLCCLVAQNNKPGKSIVAAVCALLDMGAPQSDIMAFLKDHLCTDMLRSVTK